MRSSIRHLSSVSGSPLFAAAEFTKTVHLFRTGRPDCERTIFTNLDFGGNRLQIVPQKNMLIAGAYQVHGIEGYDLNTGRRCWQRRDLKKVQSIRRNPLDESISCFFENRAGVVIDVLTGTVLSTYRGVKDIYFSHDGVFELQELQSRYRIYREKNKKLDIKAESFALLDAAFSKHQVVLSEAGGAVRIHSLDSGDLDGRYEPPAGYHVLDIKHDPKADIYVGILWGYQSAGDYFLVHISQSGRELCRFGLNDGYATAFLRDRETALLASGQEIDLRSGVETFRYKFPMHDEKEEPTKK